jgi:hypothetical protein
MTQADPGEETRIIPVGGRQVVVRKVTDAQRILLMRLVRNIVDLEGSPDTAASNKAMKNVAKILDIIDSTVVQESDWDHIEKLIITRKLDMKELVGVVTAFNEEQPTQRPVVRRGRPPKKAIK